MHSNIEIDGELRSKAMAAGVASFCIDNDDLLLHRGRDFDVFEQTRGLRSWQH